MKKILLGTTTLIGAAALFAGAAVAGETPKVTIGGYSDFQVGYSDEDLDAGTRGGAFRQETELSVKIDAKTDAGLGYGGQIDLDVSNTDDQDNEETQVGKSFVYLDGMWGRLEGGSNYGVTHTMKVDAASIARATGGIDGDFVYFLSAPAAGTRTLVTPDLALDYGATLYGDESLEALNKVSYYTPRFAGFQAGISYLFDTDPQNRGVLTGAPARGTNGAGQVDNVWLGALSYDNKFGDFAFAAAATGEWGDGETQTTEDLASWNIGAKVGYMGFSVAGSYGDLGDGTTILGASSETSYWTAGAAYEFGPFGVSATYMNSTTDTPALADNDFDNLSIGVDYKLAPGLTPYAEVSFVSVDQAVAASDNDATIFIAGTQLAF